MMRGPWIRVAMLLALLAQAGWMLRSSGQIGLCAAPGEPAAHLEMLPWCEGEEDGSVHPGVRGFSGSPALESSEGCSHRRLPTQAQHRGQRPLPPPPPALPAPVPMDLTALDVRGQASWAIASFRAPAAPLWTPLRL